jgi:hypothetical protein
VGIALLEVAAAAAANQQRIPGEGDRLVIQHEADAAVGVARERLCSAWRLNAPAIWKPGP